MTRKRRRRRHPAARARYLAGGISVVATWGIVSSLVAVEPGPVAAGPATTVATTAPPPPITSSGGS